MAPVFAADRFATPESERMAFEMKRTVAMVIAAIALFAAAFLVVLAGPLGELGSRFGWNFGTYYVQVDNDKCEPTSEDARQRFGEEMTFEYRLEGARDDGSTADLSFLTSRELRDGAYIKCDVWPLLGVRSWEEVAWEAIPEPARENLPEALPAAS